MSSVTNGPTQTVVRVWREGNRIRTVDGTGYVDTVSDEQIREHIAADMLDPNGIDRVAFAATVLLQRQLERRAGLVPA